MKNQITEDLRERALEQLKTQSFVDVALCKKFLAASERAGDWDGVAMGHLWLAESHLLNEENKIDCSRELEVARRYLEEDRPSEVLENYYAIEYKLHTALYDTQTALDYCLKALNIAEQLYEDARLVDAARPYFISTLENRFVKYYGNIGINFFNHGIYQNALLYCNKALGILESLETVNTHAECLLRLNIIISLVRTGSERDVMRHVHLLERLPMEPESLKIYVDYAYVNYYLYKREKEKIAYYIYALLHDRIERHAGRLTAVDFYIDILRFVIELNMMHQARHLLEAARSLVRSDEIRPLLSLARLRILYADTFHQQDEEPALCREYFALYGKYEKQDRDFKVSGLETRLRLTEVEWENQSGQNRIDVLKDLANYDELTKLFNRRYLELKYDELLCGEARTAGLAIIDIDYFKEYNDSYGHLAGDELLKRIAKCLQGALSDQMMACRYGGDEFVVLSWDGEPALLERCAQSVVKAVHDMHVEHKMFPGAKQITVSIGVGSGRVGTQADIQALFEEADRALYQAKERGRNQIVLSP